ncbi:hypothetical protein HDU76_012254, partial [Blyttiomyces sp. JEL0837]
MLDHKYTKAYVKKQPFTSNLRLHELYRFKNSTDQYQVDVFIRNLPGFELRTDIDKHETTFTYTMIPDQINSESIMKREDGMSGRNQSIMGYFQPESIPEKFTYSFTFPEPVDTKCIQEQNICELAIVKTTDGKK